MDAVYILGTGSLAKNIESRLSVASLRKHCLDVETIFFIGEDPKLETPYVHFDARDAFMKPWQNMLDKVRFACGLDEISDEFLLMNDDFFLNKDCLASEFPFYALKGGSGGNCGLHDFAIHAPIRIKKDWFKAMPLTPSSGSSFSPRTFYANFFKAPPTFTTDCIIRPRDRGVSFDDQVKGRDFFSTDDQIFLDQEFVSWLEKKYA